MKPTQPYQPLLLRLLHGATGLFLIAAVVTAFWTYNTYDGRWGTLPLPAFPAIEGIHGTFGLWTLLVFPLLVVYSFQRGQRRLVQPDSWPKLAQVGKPVWWYTLSRLANTLALLAVTCALFSGKMMDETWLPQGELSHSWYSAHLLSWVGVVVAIALHVLLNAKVGGLPLLASMLSRRFRAADSPRLWPGHIAAGWRAVRQSPWAERLAVLQRLPLLESGILLALVLAWVLSLLAYL